MERYSWRHVPPTQRVMSHINESCHTSTSHVTFQRVMSHINESHMHAARHSYANQCVAVCCSVLQQRHAIHMQLNHMYAHVHVTHCCKTHATTLHKVIPSFWCRRVCIGCRILYIRIYIHIYICIYVIRDTWVCGCARRRVCAGCRIFIRHVGHAWWHVWRSHATHESSHMNEQYITHMNEQRITPTNEQHITYMTTLVTMLLALGACARVRVCVRVCVFVCLLVACHTLMSHVWDVVVCVWFGAWHSWWVKALMHESYYTWVLAHECANVAHKANITYGVASISRLLQIISLFCRISSLL